MVIKSGFSARVRRVVLNLGVCLGVSLALASCGTDPIPQAIIDDLPPEKGTANEFHRPGQPCLVCHSTYGQALPALVIGGTVFKDDGTGALVPAPNVRIDVFDSTGDDRFACSNSAGNFYIEKADWEEITFPLKSFVGKAPRRMRSIIGREGSCGNCHKLSGPAHDSPGVLVVSDGEEDTGTDSCATGP